MSDQNPQRASGVYPTTQWTQIIGVIQKGDDAAAHRALGEFCEQYRLAIINFFRQRGCDSQQAEDYTHEFLKVRILERWNNQDSPLHKAERREASQFRSFLATYLRRFVLDKWKEQTRQRTGGGVNHVPLEGSESLGLAGETKAVEQFGREFDRVFALNFIQRAAEQSTHSQYMLAHLRNELSQKEAGARLGLSEDAFKMAFARFRKRFKQDLRAEIVKLVGDNEQDIQEEIRYLMALFAE